MQYINSKLNRNTIKCIEKKYKQKYYNFKMS